MITRKTILLAISALLLSFDSANSLRGMNQRNTKRAQIERAILESSEPKATKDLAASLGINTGTVKSALGQLVRLNKIEKIGAGRNTKYLNAALVSEYNDRMNGVYEIERVRRAVNNNMYNLTSRALYDEMRDTKHTTARSSLSILYRRNEIHRERKHPNGAAKYSKRKLVSKYKPIGCKRTPTKTLIESVVVNSDVPLTKRQIIEKLKGERFICSPTANTSLRRLVEGGRVKKGCTGLDVTYSRI